MGVLFDTVKRLYDEGKLTEVGVNNAVIKKWITEDERGLILEVEAIEDEPETEPEE